MGQRVLVLNASYEPLQIVSTRRAVVLLLQEKAELVEAAAQRLRAQGFSLDVPVVIRLVRYIRIPRRLRLPCSRRGVLTRDRETCQYCGIMPGRTPEEANMLLMSKPRQPQYVAFALLGELERHDVWRKYAYSID